MTLICPPGHRLAGSERIDWHGLRDEAFVDFHPDWGSRQVSDRAFATAGVPRRIASEVNDVHTLLDLVVRGLGVAVVPGPIARKKAGKLTSIPLPAEAPRWDVTVVVPAAAATAATTTFLAPIRKRFDA